MLFAETETLDIAPGAVLLRAAVEPIAAELVAEIERLVARSPLRSVMTPMGKPMSVEMTNCGKVGWVSDRRGYRYEAKDPLTGGPWPRMPHLFRNVATSMADRVGYPGFEPDACLVNRYSPGSKMGLHQDRDESDLSQPIVSVSIGLPITFKFGGTRRTDPARSIVLRNGDVVVFGGASRLAFHGVGTLRKGVHEVTGGCRYNLTFRRV